MTKVVAAVIPDEPGGLSHVIKTLGDSGVNIEYMYAFTTPKKGTACMILRVEDVAKAIEVLQKEGIRQVGQEELTEL